MENIIQQNDDFLKIKNILNNIKKIDSLNTQTYFHGDLLEYRFNVGQACSEDEIKGLENNLGYKLPEEYRFFLSQANGISLHNEVASRIYDLNEIRQIKEIIGNTWFPKNFFCFGQVADGSIFLLFDLTSKNKKNIYFIDLIADDEFGSLNCSFTDYLNLYLQTYGATFWEWKAEKTNIKKLNV